MRRIAIATLAITFLGATSVAAKPVSQDPAQVPAGHYELDPRHAALTMKVAHLGGFSRFTMRFEKLSGGFDYDPAVYGQTKATITIDPASIRTNVPGFDEQLAGPHYFDAKDHPEITFVTTGIVPEDGGAGKITGDLTFLGVTKPVTLDVVFNGVGPGLLGAGTRMGFSGTGEIKRSDFGLTTASAFAGDTVDLDIEVEFVKK
ncbi:YceI family protein [Phenylobacterium sp.]|uniref:YceI family protein n=1 Tax=Phenylobacterium sp. TaxID=1871053 RepID=UPI0035B07ADE